jgi:hypothetical protein
MMLKKFMRYISRSNLSSISIIFIVGLLPLLFHTDTNLFNNNFNISLNNVIQFAYAQQEYEDENNEDEIGDITIDDKSSSSSNSNQQQEINVIGTDDFTCQTQIKEVVKLEGIIIKPKGIRLLADFNPCQLSNGKLTLYTPITPILKLGLMYIDYTNGFNNPEGLLVSPNKVQSIDTNRGVFTLELDGKMKGKDPVTREDTTLSNINGLALYNSGDKPLEFKDGDVAILKATFTK